MEDVDARVNERVRWIAPPYRSPAQQVPLEHAREYAEQTGFSEYTMRELTDELLAAGADEKWTKRVVKMERAHEENSRRALADGTAAFSHGGQFWCTWGFKPS